MSLDSAPRPLASRAPVAPDVVTAATWGLRPGVARLTFMDDYAIYGRLELADDLRHVEAF